MSPWSFCCLRYYWSFNFAPSHLLLGLVLMAKLFIGLPFIYYLGALLFLLTQFPLLTQPFVKVFYKDQSLVLSYSFSTLFLYWSICLWHSIVHLLPCTWLLRQYSTPTKYEILSLNGCLLIFCHSISLKLSFFILVYPLNNLKYLILFF